MPRETETQKCHRKLRHADYLSAMLHARSLGADGIVIYPCTICGGLHLGHNRLRYSSHCAREGQAKIASLLKRIALHTRIAREHELIAQRLQCQLETIFITYGVE